MVFVTQVKWWNLQKISLSRNKTHRSVFRRLIARHVNVVQGNDANFLGADSDRSESRHQVKSQFAVDETRHELISLLIHREFFSIKTPSIAVKQRAFP
jgi:hypothetical protein